MSALKRRVQEEVFQVLAPVYGDRQGRLTWDETDGTWVAIKQVPVPSRLTNDGRGVIDVLIMIPSAYPQVPPDGFYCDLQLRVEARFHKGDRPDQHYPHLTQVLLQQGWQWFCAHANYSDIAGKWHPTGNVTQGDNLLTYFRLCLAILGTMAKGA